MQVLLDRERMRCDRGRARFTLLTLNFPQGWTSSKLAELGHVISERVRATDDVGFLGPRRLGVVLPETSAEGAWALAEDLGRLMPAGAARPDCEVYCYPTHPHEGCSDSSNGQSHGSSNGHKSHDSSLVNGAGGSNGKSTNGKPRRRGDREVALPMEAFFARPLPRWKRLIDITVSGLALLFLAPLMLAVAAAIKLTSPGPIIFKQQRDTIGGRRFTIYKFRTMSADAESKKADLMSLNEQDGPAFKIVKDPRITPLGRFLRVSSIDELPQLFNVLFGDMTLVGPRAMDSKESDRCETWQRRRLDVTAGITCIWQVRGRSSVTFAEWMRMDLSYVRSRSLANDLKLLAQTVPAVLFRRGAC